MTLSPIQMSSTLPLALNPPRVLQSHRPTHTCQQQLHTFTFSQRAQTCFASHSNRDRKGEDADDFLWLREEQRWLRDEQRWLREEQRWARERDLLVAQIQSLQLRIQVLEQQVSAVGLGGGDVGALLQVLQGRNLIAESGSSPIVGSIVVEKNEEVKKEKEKVKEHRTLRRGSEGLEVRAMQEALQTLGFYSGEEDMEHSSFSSGTDRAVKTWQSSVGAVEDGIMTAELLESLFLEQDNKGSQSNFTSLQKEVVVSAAQKESTNGTVVASATEFSKIEQTIIKGETKAEVSQQRVFLLGENRWEEPSRLSSRGKKEASPIKTRTTTKCINCRGEGRLMCTECDGTGEPNIEPQFLEWIDENAKCPYCEGLGYTICDVCEGKSTI